MTDWRSRAARLSAAMLMGVTATNAAYAAEPPVLLPEAQEAMRAGAPGEGRTLNGHPDLSGSWEIIDPLRRPLKPAQLTPEAIANGQADRARAQARLAAGFQVFIISYLCQYFVGTSWAGQSEPINITQTPDLTLITVERIAASWHIYTDGRSLPADVSKLPASYNGYSVGRWEGDTFVVETRGIRTLDVNPRPGISGGGYTTPNTKLTLRMRLIEDGRQLYMTATYEDPAVWLEPHTVEFTFARNTPQTHAYGYFCDPTDPASTIVVEPPAQDGAAATPAAAR